MINLDLGGACPRRPLTYVLPRAMIHPNGPADASLKGFGLSVIASNGSLLEGTAMMSGIAIKSGKPWLLANFPDERTSICDGLVLHRPHRDKFEVGMVEPCLLRSGCAMILVAADRSRAYRADPQGNLVECAVPRPARAAAGVERAWDELKRRMHAVLEGKRFRYESWEILVPGMSAPLH